MRALLVSVALLALGSCAPLPPVATAADAQRANVQLADLEQGRKLLVTKCASCHKAPLPSEPWQATMDDMAHKARLDAEQRRLVEQYLTVMGPGAK